MSNTLFDGDTYLGGVKHAEQLLHKGWTIPKLDKQYYKELHFNGNIEDEWLKGFGDYILHVRHLKNLKLI